MVPHLYNVAKITAIGSSITLGSTVFSCYLALEIEKAAHRAQFKMFPHWYANVEHANGIDPDMLASVRAAFKEKEQATQQLTTDDQTRDEHPLEEADKFSTKTVFTMERFVKPVRDEMQRRTRESTLGIDLGACAMTA